MPKYEVIVKYTTNSHRSKTIHETISNEHNVDTSRCIMCHEFEEIENEIMDPVLLKKVLKQQGIKTTSHHKSCVVLTDLQPHLIKKDIRMALSGDDVIRVLRRPTLIMHGVMSYYGEWRPFTTRAEITDSEYILDIELKEVI